ncbi:hypothetical protein [Huintestinicola sp.]
MRRFIISIIGAFITCAGVMVLCIEFGLPKAFSFIIDEGTAIALIGTICFATFVMALKNAYCIFCAENKATENEDKTTGSNTNGDE